MYWLTYNLFVMTLILIVLGALLSLAGLVAIAPQVQVHRIDARSKAAWLFRGGAGLLILGQLVGLASSLEPSLVTVSLIMGGAILFGGLAVGSHERQQASFQLKTSLSLQMVGVGVVVLLLAWLLS